MFEVLFKPYNEGEERKGHMKEKRRMISEAARQLGLETYHLRTWEEEFSLTIPRNEKGYRCYTSDKMMQFQKVLVKIMGLAILEQKDHIADQISSKVSDRVVKEMDYQFRLREAEEEKRFQKLDEMIRNQQKAREEIAASREKRRFFRRKRKER